MVYLRTSGLWFTFGQVDCDLPVEKWAVVNLRHGLGFTKWAEVYLCISGLWFTLEQMDCDLPMEKWAVVYLRTNGL